AEASDVSGAGGEFDRREASAMVSADLPSAHAEGAGALAPTRENVSGARQPTWMLLQPGVPHESRPAPGDDAHFVPATGIGGVKAGVPCSAIYVLLYSSSAREHRGSEVASPEELETRRRVLHALLGRAPRTPGTVHAATTGDAQAQ